MFLSQIDIAVGRRQGRRFLGSPQVVHASVMAACSPAEPTAQTDGRVLWRLDSGTFGHKLYIVSPQRPRLDRLVDEVAPLGARPRIADYDPFLDRLAAGEMFAFRLTANPVRAVSMGDGCRGKRFGHVTAEQQARWLGDRAERNGFALVSPVGSSRAGDAGTGNGVNGGLNGMVVRRERPSFGRRNPTTSSRDRVTINRVTYEGVLTVTDGDLFRRALTHGIGASKAYGCGLLTVAPVSR